MKYIVYKHFEGIGIDGNFDIPVGAECECENKLISYQGREVCYIASENAHKYFMRNDDGNGIYRGELIDEIVFYLHTHEEAWELVVNDPICQAYRRIEHDDNWLWSNAFYNASIETLEYIEHLIGADVPEETDIPISPEDGEDEQGNG